MSSVIDKLFGFARRVGAVQEKVDGINLKINDAFQDQRSKLANSFFQAKASREAQPYQRSSRYIGQDGSGRIRSVHPNLRKYNELISSSTPISGGSSSICGGGGFGTAPSQGQMVSARRGVNLRADINACIEASERLRAEGSKLKLRQRAVGELASQDWPTRSHNAYGGQAQQTAAGRANKAVFYRFGETLDLEKPTPRSSQAAINTWEGRVSAEVSRLKRGYMNWLSRNRLQGLSGDDQKMAENYAYDDYQSYRVGLKPEKNNAPAPYDAEIGAGRWWNEPGLVASFEQSAGLEDFEDTGTIHNPKSDLDALPAPAPHNYVRSLHANLGPLKFLSPAYVVTEGVATVGSLTNKILGDE